MTASEIALVRYDVSTDEILKDEDDRCIAVERGEPGLLLAQINEAAAFEGYTDKEATEQKILRNAFVEGDAWFNTGDLLREIEAGYTLGYPHYQFVDRVGDTFRWKSENVSTNEVGEILNGFPDIQFSNVYGVQVPNADGRAGMAALTLEPALTPWTWRLSPASSGGSCRPTPSRCSCGCKRTSTSRAPSRCSRAT